MTKSVPSGKATKKTFQPPVIFIHGMWGTGKVWEKIAPRFNAAGFSTNAITLRHHDTLITEPAPDGLGTTSLIDYVDDVLAVVDAMDTPPVLVGHSMGGLIAQLVAARTDNVRAVIALTPGPPAGVFALKISTLALFRKILLARNFWKNPTRMDWQTAYNGLYHALPEAEAREHYADHVWESGRALFEIAFWLMDKTKAAKLDYENIKCPVLFVAGANDRIVSAAVVKTSAKRYKGKADYVAFAELSHGLLSEPGWENVADKCMGWLTKPAV